MSTHAHSPARIGVVVIGRNEGERLRRSLRSIESAVHPTVYVDSGSTDGSVARARTIVGSVVELDLATPFTAGRARNAGFARLREIAPDVELVQFIDGDCEIVPGWIETAERVLFERPDVVAVCGRRRERFPAASIYNRLCDLEWDTPVGEAEECGGDALVRAGAFRAVGGFDPALIAGEEPELCLRLRAAGWKILRLDAEMTLHDAAITRFAQWWKRSLRTGHTAAVALDRPGASGDRGYARRAVSAAFWTLLTFAMLASATLLAGLAAHVPALATLFLLAFVWLALFVRIVWRRRARGDRIGDAALYAAACLAGKWPEAWGAMLYLRDRWQNRASRWIEYKDVGTPPCADASIDRGSGR